MKKIYLILLLIISVYFVIGGISNVLIDQKFEAANLLEEKPTSDLNNDRFRNIQEQEASEEQDKLEIYYPMYARLGSTLSYIITLMSFGVLGSIIRILLMSLSSKIVFEKLKIYTIPILGALMGLLTITLSDILPDFKDESGFGKVYYSIAFLGGIYTEEFFIWLKKKFQQTLNTENDLEEEKSDI